MARNGYSLKPLTPTEANQLRQEGGVAYTADSKPGYPCRQCLRDAEVGEELLLVSHTPFTYDSPYRSASPIFIHKNECTADECAPDKWAPDGQGTLPTQLTIRQLSVRAFDTKEMMTEAAVVSGTDFDETLTTMFNDPLVATMHIHNAVRGCWATNVERAPRENEQRTTARELPLVGSG